MYVCRKVAYGAREVAYGAGEVAYGAREVAYGDREVAYGAGEVAYGAGEHLGPGTTKSVPNHERHITPNRQQRYRGSHRNRH